MLWRNYLEMIVYTVSGEFMKNLLSLIISLKIIVISPYSPQTGLEETSDARHEASFWLVILNLSFIFSEQFQVRAMDALQITQTQLSLPHY